MLEPTPTRPMPRPSWLTEEFWQQASAGTLVVQRCRDCHRHFFRPEAACPRCFSEQWEWDAMAGTGAIHSFTVVHRPALPDMVVPYVVADVELDEGVHMMTNIVGCEPDDVCIGLPVRCTFVRIDELALPFFTPTATTSHLDADS